MTDSKVPVLLGGVFSQEPDPARDVDKVDSGRTQVRHMSQGISRVADAERTPVFDLQRSALLLDIDGTLIDIAPTPESVVVPPDLVKVLENLFRLASGAVAFVSGRRISEVDALFQPLRLPAIGCHGAEFRANRHDDVEEVACISESLRRRLAEIAQMTPGVLSEDKCHTFAIHFRAVPEAEPILLRALAEHRAALAAADLQMLKGKAVIEIKPRWFNKGTAIARLMRHAPFAGRVPVFLGDDTTDEDVFRVLPEYDGLGYSVGRPLDGAAYTFPAPSNVRRWLGQIAGI
jgi:trehalose 6-phosphate phosphatase